jgi:hypothetical protein
MLSNCTTHRQRHSKDHLLWSLGTKQSVSQLAAQDMNRETASSPLPPLGTKQGVNCLAHDMAETTEHANNKQPLLRPVGTKQGINLGTWDSSMNSRRTCALRASTTLNSKIEPHCSRQSAKWPLCWQWCREKQSAQITPVLFVELHHTQVTYSPRTLPQPQAIT